MADLDLTLADLDALDARLSGARPSTALASGIILPCCDGGGLDAVSAVCESLPALLAAARRGLAAGGEKDSILVNGIQLKREGADVVVLIDAHGAWIEVIRERAEGPISHIVEESGLKAAIKEAADKFSHEYLAASGGIVDAP